MDAILDIITYTVDTDRIVQNTYGTGFYIDSTHIVASANTMLASSFTPEQATSYYLQRVQKIIGINRAGDSFELTLIGMSPLLDVAVLTGPTNNTYLSWYNGCVCRGQTVYSAYDMAQRDPHAFVEGPVIDNSMTDSSDPLIPELINVDIPYTPSMQGAPLLVLVTNECDPSYQVVGVVGSTLYYQSGGQFGGSQIGTHTANGVVSRLLQPAVNDIINNTNVAYNSSPYGQWRQWILPSLEALYQYVTPYSLLSQLGAVTTNTLSQPYPAHKIQGAMIVQIGPTSTLGNYLYEGDVIESINNIPIGIDNSSVTTALLTTNVGQNVNLTVRDKGSNYQGTSTVPATVVPATMTDVPYPVVSLSGNLGASSTITVYSGVLSLGPTGLAGLYVGTWGYGHTGPAQIDTSYVSITSATVNSGKYGNAGLVLTSSGTYEFFLAVPSDITLKLYVVTQAGSAPIEIDIPISNYSLSTNNLPSGMTIGLSGDLLTITISTSSPPFQPNSVVSFTATGLNAPTPLNATVTYTP